MVKGFDPTADDRVKFIFDTALRYFYNQNSITKDKAQEKIQKWFSDATYDPFFAKFRALGVAPPRIRLRSSCGSEHRHFPAYWMREPN